MFKMEDKNSKNLAKNVFVLPLIVIFVACSSKQIKNASTEPLDLPAEDSASFSDTSYADSTYDSSLADTSLSIPPVSEAQYSEPMPTAAPVKSIKKKAKKKRGMKVAAKGTVRKKSARHKHNKMVSKVQDVPPPSAPTETPTPSAAATLAQELPVIGEENLQTAPIEMPPIAPPIPPAEIEAEAQPNWMLAAFIIAGIVALGALGLRVRRHAIRKRGLIFN